MSALALLGGDPLREEPWLTWPVASSSTVEVLRAVLDSRRWSSTGLVTGERSFDDRFSVAFASYIGTAHCITTPNGTTALRIALEAAGIGWGDEVVIPATTWVADLDAVLSVGAVPVFADIDPDTLCMSTAGLQRVITERTRAVIVVHLYGAVARLDELRDVAEAHALVVIEDAAQAHGSRWNGTRVGSVGQLGVFSMHNSKLLTCGEGGAVTTSDAGFASRAIQLTTNGRVPIGRPDVGGMAFAQGEAVTGTNARLSEFQAAVLLDMLPRLDHFNDVCVLNARRLAGRLRLLGFETQSTAPASVRTFSALCVRVPEALRARVPLDVFSAAVHAECRASFKRVYAPLDSSPLVLLESRPSWRWIVDNSSARERLRGPNPIAAGVYASHLMLPHPYLRGTTAETDLIADATEKVFDNIDDLATLS